MENINTNENGVFNSQLGSLVTYIWSLNPFFPFILIYSTWNDYIALKNTKS